MKVNGGHTADAVFHTPAVGSTRGRSKGHITCYNLLVTPSPIAARRWRFDTAPHPTIPAPPAAPTPLYLRPLTVVSDNHSIVCRGRVDVMGLQVE